MSKGYLLFPTSLGRAGIAWNDRGLIAVELPDVGQGKPLARLRAAAGSDAPSDAHDLPWIADAIARLTRYFDGADEDLSTIPLDYSSAPPFHRKVYDVACRIDRGQILTYGDLAAQAGSPGASRAVGQALARNPLPILVPCHRVVAAGGKPGGFSAPGGLITKARLLALEGARLAL